jgi:hypothetical protein
MLPEYVSKYQTMTPKPWGESREALQNITDDILKQWTRKSVPRAEFPCRKIVFTIKSHDQGWGGGPGQRGTYHGSSTWFDIGLERMSSLREGQIPCLPTG